MLELCGSYLFQGGSEQIGPNSAAGVYFMSQHAAKAWAPHRRPSLASTPVCFMLESRPPRRVRVDSGVCVVAGAELCFSLFLSSL